MKTNDSISTYISDINACFVTQTKLYALHLNRFMWCTHFFWPCVCNSCIYIDICGRYHSHYSSLCFYSFMCFCYIQIEQFSLEFFSVHAIYHPIRPYSTAILNELYAVEVIFVTVFPLLEVSETYITFEPPSPGRSFSQSHTHKKKKNVRGIVTWISILHLFWYRLLNYIYTAIYIFYIIRYCFDWPIQIATPILCQWIISLENNRRRESGKELWTCAWHA